MSRPEDQQLAKPVSAKAKAEAEAVTPKTEAAATTSKPAWATAEADKVAPQPNVEVQEGQPIASAKADEIGESGPSDGKLRGRVEPTVPLGRNAEALAGAGVETAAVRAKPPKSSPKPPRLSPRQRLRRYAALVTSARFIGGVVLLGLLFLLLTSGQAWPTLLFGWVLLTILADEFDGWFGYIGAFMGLLTLIGPSPSGDPVWQVILPLVGGGLLGLLVVKHSGGPLVLPFAGAVFALPIYAAANYGELLDSNLILVANPDLFRSAVIAMLIGLGISLVRQLIAWATDMQARYAERRLLRADQIRAENMPADEIPAR